MDFRETSLEMKALAWSYVRLSTAEQLADGRHGEARQLDAAASYAKEHGLYLQPVVADLGVSAFKGKHRKSGNLSKFLALIEAGLVPKNSYFLVENCDRLSREDPLTAFAMFTAIINAGINVVTTDDRQFYNRDSLQRDPMKLVFWIMNSIRGNAESKRKSEMVTKAARKRLDGMRAEGKALSGRVPTWLVKIGEGRYEVDPIKKLVIERIFREIDAGMGGTKIAQRLNADKIPPFNDYKRATRGWHHAVIISLARNRAVIGEHQQTKLIGEGDDQVRVPDGEPISDFYPRALDDEALFYRVQARIRERSEKRGNQNGGRKGAVLTNIMSGVELTCRHCGGRMLFRGAYGVTRAVLKCGNSMRGHACESGDRFDYQNLETAILNFVAEVDLSAQVQRSEAEVQLDLLIARRTDLQTKISNLLDQMEEGRGDPLIAQRLRDRATEREELESRIGELRLRVRESASAQLPRHHQEAVQRLFAEFATMSSDQLYVARSRLGIALASIVDKIEFENWEGRRVANLYILGGAKTYGFDGRTGELIGGFDLTPLIADGKLDAAEFTKGDAIREDILARITNKPERKQGMMGWVADPPAKAWG